MLQVTIPDKELFDNKTQEFFTIKGAKLSLEHSLVSISKWEAKWQKPFLREEPMTIAETLDYIKCMTLTQNVDPSVYGIITPEVLSKVQAYIDNPMTATTFSEEKKPYIKNSKKKVTSEEIYYWMVALNIPFECQKWHLNRLLTLIRICEIKSKPPKKMAKKDVYNMYDELNAKRKAALGTTG